MGKIGVIFPREAAENTAGLDTCIRDLPTGLGIERFNVKHAHVYGTKYWFERDSFVVGFVHNEFPSTIEGAMVYIYTLREARRWFPFLFVDTNPLLWRKFT